MSGPEPLALWSGWPDLLRWEAALRWALVLLGLLWGALAVRARPRVTLACGLLFAIVASGFWVAALARPYGLPFDVPVAREAASAVLTASRGRAGGLAPDAPFVGGLWARLALIGVPEGVLVNLPTLLPMLVLPALALLLHGLWRSPAAPLAAVLWLTCATGELATLRGAGFLPGLWSRPVAALGLLLGVFALLHAGRARRLPRLLWAPWALLGFGLSLQGPSAALPAREALLLASVDQGPWWLLALLSRRRWDGVTRTLLAAGGLALAAGACGAPVDPWGAQALLRLGLLLGAARTLVTWLPLAGRRLVAGLRPWRAGRLLSAGSTTPPALALGLLIALLAPSSAHVWWRPQALDVSVPGSLAPWPEGLLQATQWMRAHTRRDAVFVTSPAWSAAVPILAARRVLHAPGRVDTWDAPRRARLSYLALAGTSAQGWRQARRYRVTHLFAGPDDLRAWNLASWDEVETRGRFRLRFEAHGFRVYELAHWGTLRPGSPKP